MQNLTPDELRQALLKSIAEWKQLFEEEQSNPTLSPEAHIRARKLYKQARLALTEWG